jgi:hypothetical protein
MDDEVLAGHAALVGVVLTREDERRLDPHTVDLHGRRVRVLLDDREDVRQQAALEVGEVGAIDGRMMVGADLVDRSAPSARTLPCGSPYAALGVTTVRNLVRPLVA